MKEPKPKAVRSKAPATLETARDEVHAKVAKAGAKGTASVMTAATKEPKRSLYGQALEALEAEGTIYVDRSKAKPKYFTVEYAPTVATAADKIEQLAARRHPSLSTVADLKKALTKSEQPLAPTALELLESDRRLVKLLSKTSAVFAHAQSLRQMLGVPVQPAPPPAAVAGQAIRRSYDHLVRLTGFPDVEIAALQHHSEVSMKSLKDWLLAEHRNGRVTFGIGDWSLASEATRAGVIDMRGDRYLLVRLED